MLTKQHGANTVEKSMRVLKCTYADQPWEMKAAEDRAKFARKWAAWNEMYHRCALQKSSGTGKVLS